MCASQKYIHFILVLHYTPLTGSCLILITFWSYEQSQLSQKESRFDFVSYRQRRFISLLYCFNVLVNLLQKIQCYISNQTCLYPNVLPSVHSNYTSRLWKRWCVLNITPHLWCILCWKTLANIAFGWTSQKDVFFNILTYHKARIIMMTIRMSDKLIAIAMITGMLSRGLCVDVPLNGGMTVVPS